MVINHKDQWIYLAAPKTGSSTLHYLFSFPPFNGYCPGMSVEGLIEEQHDMRIPEGCEDYKVIISVRDPYSRAVSLFTHYQKDFAHLPEAKSFPVFVEKILLPKTNDFFAWDQVRWYKEVPRVDHIIRLEYLWADVHEAGLVHHPFAIPWENRITVTSWQSYYRSHPGTLELVRQWGEEDFEAYGYGR